MADMNMVAVSGRLTKDAVLKNVGSNGTALCSFTIANNTGFGQYARTNFFNVNLWGKQGESLAQYLTKGKQVGVTGTIENQRWTDGDGKQHDNWTIKAMGDIWLGARPQSKAEEEDVPTF